MVIHKPKEIVPIIIKLIEKVEKNIDFYKFFYEKKEELNFCNEKIYISSYNMWWQRHKTWSFRKKITENTCKSK